MVSSNFQVMRLRNHIWRPTPNTASTLANELNEWYKAGTQGGQKR